jgi:transcriptional regulator with XRE-family HTH domain
MERLKKENYPRGYWNMPTETERLPLRSEAASQNMSTIGRQLLESYKTGKEYRHAFSEEKVRTQLAAQIKAIREQREMKRPELAALMDKAPSWIFRLEDPNLPPPTIVTLLKVAEAFDVDLDIRFVRFTDFLRRVDGMSDADFQVPSFLEDVREFEEAELDRKISPEPNEDSSGQVNVEMVREKGGLGSFPVFVGKSHAMWRSLPQRETTGGGKLIPFESNRQFKKMQAQPEQNFFYAEYEQPRKRSKA